jgi:parallel beta-helix repeat protein
MKKIGRRFLGILTLTILAFVIVGIYLATKATPPQVGVSPTFAIRGPISIGEDADFTRVGAGKGCECASAGSGTERDPYVISNWVINASGTVGITVFGTNSYFMIKRVQVQGDGLSAGIKLDQVQNGKIEDSSVINNFIAVYVFQSSNLEFINNTIEQNTYGIQLEASNSNRLSSNRFSQIREVAIFVRGSDNSVIGNVVRGAFGAINIDGTAGAANGNLIEENSVSNTTEYGIGVWRAAQTTVRSNSVTHSQGIGIFLTDRSSNNLVEENQVTENKGGGILLDEETSYNSIRGNTAKGNGDGVRLFDLTDTGSGNTWENNSCDTKNPETLD